MDRVLEQIIISQSKQIYKYIYIRVQSKQVYISSTLQINFSGQAKCQLLLAISQKHPLTIQLWNYQPHQLLKSWSFQNRDVMRMKDKHMISDDNWIIYLKKTEEHKENKENKYTNKSQSSERVSSKLKMRGSKLKDNKKKREQINFILEHKKNSKQSIKKTLKNTIQYLIKQQSVVNAFQQYGIQDQKLKFKTAKCTPAQQISNLKSHSTLFSQYGLNMTELPIIQTEKNPNFQFEKAVQSKKRQIKPR